MNATGDAESRTHFLPSPETQVTALFPRHFGPDKRLYPSIARREKPSVSLAILTAIAGITSAAPATACAFQRPKRLAVASATLFCESTDQSWPIPPLVLTRISTDHFPIETSSAPSHFFLGAAVRLLSLSLSLSQPFFSLPSAFTAPL